MPLLNNFFQNSILLLLFICLLTMIFVFRNKKSRTHYNRSETADRKLHQLEEKFLRLQAENISLKKELQRLEDDINMRDENSRKWRQKRKNEKVAAVAAEEEVRNNLSQYYHKGDTLMNRPESLLFFYINTCLDEIFLNRKDRDYYYLFPQVNIFSFIQPNENIPEKIIGGKNVDFLLCHCQYSNNAKFFQYEPILMIEIDGPAHFYPIYEESFPKTQENDQLKNELANELKLPLLRYRLRLPEGKIEASDKTRIHTALRKFFSDHSANQTEYIYYYDQNGTLTKNQYYNPPPITQYKDGTD